VNPLDPAVAALRCWVHEDCLEHPGLALACAGGVSVDFTASASDDYGCLLSVNPTYGDGHGNADGDGDGCGDCSVGEVPRFPPGDGGGGGRDLTNRVMANGAPSSEPWAEEDPRWTIVTDIGPWLREDGIPLWELGAGQSMRLHLEGW